MKTKKMLTLTLILPVLVVVGGCSLLERNSNSGYGNQQSSSVVRSKTRKSSQDFAQSQKSDIPKSEKVRLQSFENSLNTRKEIEQYSKLLPWFKNDQERLEFLAQGSFEEKQKWLNDQNFMSRPQSVTGEMKELVDAQDITIGMPQGLVKKSWGDPDTVEVSGNPQFKNERWRYNKYVSTSDGYKAEKKSVYFEGGKVVGWEVE